MLMLQITPETTVWYTSTLGLTSFRVWRLLYGYHSFGMSRSFTTWLSLNGFRVPCLPLNKDSESFVYKCDWKKCSSKGNKKCHRNHFHILLATVYLRERYLINMEILNIVLLLTLSFATCEQINYYVCSIITSDK